MKTWVLITAGVVVLLVVVSVLTAKPTPTAKATATAISTPKTTATATPTPKPTATATPTPKPTATATPTPKPPATATPTAKATATPKPKATPTPQATIVADYEASCTAATVSQQVNSPGSYDGTSVTFQATIVNFLQDSSGDTTAMNVSDPNDITSLMYIQLSDYADVTQMNKGDTVTIWGDANGDISGKNAYGGTINESSAYEVYLTDTTTGYADNSDPNPS